MSTATEILLRIQEGERLFNAYRDFVYEHMHERVFMPLLRREMWRQHLLSAMRATAFQLTYNPKD